MRQRRVWLIVGLAGVAALAALAIAVFSVLPRSSSLLKERIVQSLSAQLDSDVTIASVRVRFLPRWRVDLDDLIITKRDRGGMPPLIRIQTITATGGWLALSRRHVSDVAVSGLVISIPPSSSRGGSSDGTLPAGAAGFDGQGVVIDRLTTAGARLVIIPDTPGKSPKIWNIRDLRLESLGNNHAMPFRASLTNAVPPGDIVTQGVLGPWQADNPGATSLEGTFTFDRADLSVFKGISGMLSAHGEFGGSIQKIGVHGETDVPRFTLTIGGHPVPLHADYHSTVDGTNGNTVLDRIDASFLNTSLVAQGSVIDTPGPAGRTVVLNVSMTKARIEDVLRLAVKGSPAPIAGALTLSTKLVIPPGDRDVVEKLRLDGTFAIGTATFASFDIQDKVNTLSQRGRGEVTVARSRVVSNFLGEFHLAEGVLALKTLNFDVPGARVQLAGTYALRAEQLAFRGALELDAKMSETQRGWKRLVLKALDPIFSKQGGGGTYLPIKIEGSRSQPAFGVDRGALFKRREPAKRANTPARSSPETHRHPHPG